MGEVNELQQQCRLPMKMIAFFRHFLSLALSRHIEWALEFEMPCRVEM